MDIRLYKIDQYNCQTVRTRFFQPGIDLEGSTHFEIDFTAFSDYSGGLVERSNARVLRQLLEEEGIDYKVQFWHFFGESTLIPVEFLDHPLISDIIEGLDNYPLIDSDDYNSLEYDLTLEFLVDEVAAWALRDFEESSTAAFEAAVIAAYWDIVGEGVLFETGAQPYLNEKFIQAMRGHLIKDGWKLED